MSKWQNIIEENLKEIKSEYTMSVKKAIVDFVLGDSLNKNASKSHGNDLTKERIELSTIALKYKHK